MKQLAMFIAVWVVCVSFTYNADKVHSNLHNSTIPWKFKTESSNTKMYSRWLFNANKEKRRQLKCCIFINSSDSLFKREMQNPEFAKQWLSRVELSKVEIIRPNQEWNTYLLFDLPWPMAKRDIVINNHLIESENEIRINLTGIREDETASDDITRMKGFYGYWKYTKKSGAIEYSFYSDVKSKVPVWVTDPFIDQSILSSIEKFKLALEAETK